MTTKRYYSLSDIDLRQEFLIFSKRPAKNVYPELRAEYRDLACKKCGRFDAMELIQKVGLPDDVVPPVRRDWMVSSDSQHVISLNSKRILESVPGAEAFFLPLPAAPDYFVMFPKYVLEPPPGTKTWKDYLAPPQKGNPFAVSGRRCKICGRKESSFWTNYCQVPEDLVLGAAKVTMTTGPFGYWWIGSKEVADALKKAQLTGWRIQANEFLN